MLDFIEKNVARGDGVVVREEGLRPRLPLDAFAIPPDRIEVLLATARPHSELVETCPEWRPLPLVRLVGRWVRQLPVGDRGHGAQHRLGLDGVAQWCGRWRSCWQGRTTAGDHEDGHGGDRQACHHLACTARSSSDNSPRPSVGTYSLGVSSSRYGGEAPSRPSAGGGWVTPPPRDPPADAPPYRPDAVAP